MVKNVLLVTGITLTFALEIIIDLTSAYSTPGSAVMLHREGTHTCCFDSGRAAGRTMVPALPGTGWVSPPRLQALETFILFPVILQP